MKIGSYLFSFAKARGNIAAVALAAVLMAANATVASAQNKAAESNGTENTIGGVDNLFGIDPSSAICTSKGTAETDGNKIVCLYNVGAKKFLSIGGLWGTQAALDGSPHSIYMTWNGGSKTYFLASKVAGSSAGLYMGIAWEKFTRKNGVFMDRGSSDWKNCIVTFEKGVDYTEKNKVYLVNISKQGYLTAYPDNENKICNYASKATEGTPEYKNQEWKVITKNEYYLLFHTNPAYMKSPVDASFLITCPDFRINDTDAAKWLIGGENLSDDVVKSHVYFGDQKMYKTYNIIGNTKDESWIGRTEPHQQKYGQYFYCYTKGLRGFNIYQDVKVHKAGWYLLRCNGLSTANSSESITANGKPLANLFITALGADGKPIKEIYSAATLDGISQADAEALGNTYEGAGIGRAFFEGKYENQVQICLDKAPNGNEISNDNPVTLRIGFYVDPTPDGKPEVDANELTAVDEFKLLYAGPRRNPELILDEESTDLLYLTKAADEYKNSVLHLNRKLNDNMWNSLILPVDLTWGQMKRTFGDAVKVAKLAALTENSVQFVTVEPDSDEQVMVKAFEPYIVFPPYTQVKSTAYTVEHFYTSEGEDNSEWLGTDYQPSKDENNRLTKKLEADHYDITMVSLDREKLNDYVNTTNWESTTTVSATGGGMVCKGTMAKTYDNGKIISGRDDLNGDYFMYKGKLIQVPSGNKGNGGERYSYGLKAFRCWFELTGNTSAGGTTGKSVSLLIDGVEDSTTGIADIHGGTDRTSYKRGIDGVFNMNGQMVRRGSSLEGLPKGLYVVDGKKMIIR